MYKDSRYINAGQNEIYRWGKKAQEIVTKHMTPNESGFYSIPADGGKYYTIGTSSGKFGDYARFGSTYLSVNSYGKVWAKVGTEKADAFLSMLKEMLRDMADLMNGKESEDCEE